jgi:hypothetical protein
VPTDLGQPPQLAHLALSALRFDSMWSLLFFRSLPFVASGVAGPRVPMALRAFWACLFAALMLIGAHLGFHPREVLVSCGAALSYFSLLALGVHVAGANLQQRRVGKPAIALGLAIACVVVPGVAFPSAILAPASVWGWEIMLSSYSYCVDNESATDRPSMSDCIVFIIVNPSLIYRQRGQPWSGIRPFAWGIMRCCLGLLAWMASDCVLALFHAAAPPVVAPAELFTPHGYYRLIRGYVPIFIGYYWLHSGLASVQIGFAAISGRRLRECYRFPFLSQSPADFWKRWNVWVSSWATRYIFVPLGLTIQRRVQSAAARQAAGIVAVMTTFLIMGGLHDLGAAAGASFGVPGSATSLRHFRGTLMFAWFGGILLLWSAVERFLSRRAPREDRYQPAKTVARACVVLQLLFVGHAISSWWSAP